VTALHGPLRSLLYGRLGDVLLESDLVVSPELEREFAEERRRENAAHRAGDGDASAPPLVPARRART
jgi:hypothetical protein